MPETVAATDVRLELELAEQQAVELWRQAEQISAAYRATIRRADRLRDQLRGTNQTGQHHETRATAAVHSPR